MKILRKSGISLMEVLVAFLIFSLLMGGLFGIFSAGNQFWLTFQDKAALQGELRRAIYTLTQELREAKGILIVRDETSTALRFERPRHGMIAYIFHSSGPEAQQIVREHNAQKKVLANNISNFLLDYKDDAVLIDLTATRARSGRPSLSFRIRERVTLRL